MTLFSGPFLVTGEESGALFYNIGLSGQKKGIATVSVADMEISQVEKITPKRLRRLGDHF